CACSGCKSDCRSGCINPHKCAEPGRLMLDDLDPMWISQHESEVLTSTIQPGQSQKNDCRDESEGRILFSPTTA
ncbi:uncharacterized protein BT62DRAFT_820520, partial [Guyanagaster necrorhizus]